MMYLTNLDFKEAIISISKELKKNYVQRIKEKNV